MPYAMRVRGNFPKRLVKVKGLRFRAIYTLKLET